MGLIIKPNIKVDDILIEADKDAEIAVNRILNDYGKTMPVIKIGNYVLAIDELEEFTIKFSLNNLPKITLRINDEQFKIREALRNDIDKCTIFYGFKNWYCKFNGKLDTTYSEIGDSEIIVYGSIDNNKLFEGKQFSFKDKTVTDILKSLCQQTGMGLFSFDSPDLANKLNYGIMTGTRFIDYFNFIIENYTDSIYSIDSHYHYHVGNVEYMKKKPVDKYSLNWRNGEKLSSEKPLILKSRIKAIDGKPEDVDYKIPIDLYTTNTNFTEIFYETYSSYHIGDDKEIREVKSNNNIGIGSNMTNTFSGFKQHKNPYYRDRINKLIGGNLIKAYFDKVIFEILPLSIVEVELYLPPVMGKPIRLDTEHSGKKIVISNEITFLKTATEFNKMTQILELI